MKVKIKDLDTINSILLEQLIEEAVMSGICIALNRDLDTFDVEKLYLNTADYKERVFELHTFYEEKFALNTEIANKTLKAERLVNCVTNEVEEYELLEYSEKPFDVTVSKKYVEV